MEASSSATPVAIINSNEDIIDLLRLFFADEGIASISGHVADFKRGRQDFIAFLNTYQPQVIVYDIAPPYEENWQFFQLVRQATEARGCRLILTTTNKTILERLIGEVSAFEIIGKPFDLQEVVTAVKHLLEQENVGTES